MGTVRIPMAVLLLGIALMVFSSYFVTRFNNKRRTFKALAVYYSITGVLVSNESLKYTQRDVAAYIENKYGIPYAETAKAEVEIEKACIEFFK